MELYPSDALYLLTIGLLTLCWMMWNYPLWGNQKRRRQRRYTTVNLWRHIAKKLKQNEDYDAAIKMKTDERSALFSKAWPHICNWRLKNTTAAMLQATDRHYLKQIFDRFRLRTTWDPWFLLMKKDKHLWKRAQTAISDAITMGADIKWKQNEWLYPMINEKDLFKEIWQRLGWRSYLVEQYRPILSWVT